MMVDILGDTAVTRDPIACGAYRHDASLFGGTEASVVVRPRTTEDVSQVLAAAHKNGIPVVVRGGGASIYGQPKGRPGNNLLIDMTGMDDVIEVNPRSLTVTAQAGIIMGKLQHACRSEGFYVFAPFAPLHIVSLGGWMSGAAGSAGLWTDIVGMTVVLPDGTVVKTGGGPGTNVHQPIHYNRNLGGPDFSGLFIGDGGSFGIKTEATIRMTQFPPVLRAAILEFDSIEQVLEMVAWHTARVNPHPFDPIMVFGPGAMKNFMPDFEEINSFTAQGMMQGHDERVIEAKHAVFKEQAEKLGGKSNPMLDAMAAAMASSGSGEGDMEMDWLSLFNALGLAAWLPFTLPREGFLDVYRKLMDWRTERLDVARQRGLVCKATWEFFTPTDPSSLIGEIDAFFDNAESDEVRAFVISMMKDFQEFAHSLGSIDVYNQGLMAGINAGCWSPGYASLFRIVKSGIDPAGILNPGLWTPAAASNRTEDRS